MTAIGIAVVGVALPAKAAEVPAPATSQQTTHVPSSGHDCDPAPSTACLTLVNDVQGGPASPEDWTLTVRLQAFDVFDRDWYDYGPPQTVSSGDTIALTPEAGLGRYRLSESGGPDGYNQTGLTCSGASSSGSDWVMLGSNNEATCTFTNTYIYPTVTVRKTWVDGVAGDTADLSVTVVDGDTAKATSTSNGQSGSWTDSDNTATVRASAGAQVTVAEVLGDQDAGLYTSTLSCEDGTALVHHLHVHQYECHADIHHGGGVDRRRGGRHGHLHHRRSR